MRVGLFVTCLIDLIRPIRHSGAPRIAVQGRRRNPALALKTPWVPASPVSPYGAGAGTVLAVIPDKRQRRAIRNPDTDDTRSWIPAYAGTTLGCE
ncbi:MAG: hypothetical protein ACREV0_04870 [Burkholderiales bacterium]